MEVHDPPKHQTPLGQRSNFFAVSAELNKGSAKSPHVRFRILFSKSHPKSKKRQATMGLVAFSFFAPSAVSFHLSVLLNWILTV
jgi:hypothetical protein